jgi:cytochrome c oxidase subunit 2
MFLVRRPLLAAAGLAAPLVLAGCRERQSTLNPASHASHDIADLWWAMLIGSSIVVSVVTLLVVVAALRARGRREAAQEDGRGSRGLVFVGGFVVPILVLITLFVLTLRTLPATSAPRGHTDLTVQVTGRQWFWDVRYLGGTTATTANELHIPVRRPVRLIAKTADVIHSFWVPELNRKIDMIPGKTNSILLEADHAGTYRGQCAEFCGLQHAHMAFLVVAEAPARFRSWLANEARPARKPTTLSQRRGLGVFTSVGCGGCHTIAGTKATGTIGPNLTHLASRRTLAAATIPNAGGYLAGWILDPQHVKPGNRMPGFDLAGNQVQELLDYLRSLK